MKDTILGWILPEWTASRSDHNWPWTHLLGAIVATLPLYIYYAIPYAIEGEAVPLAPATAAIFLYFALVPALALREQTEILFDITRLCLNITILGVLLFVIGYWVTEGGAQPEDVNVFANPVLAAAATITLSSLYGSTILGIMWVLQFARKGTSGVESGPQ